MRSVRPVVCSIAAGFQLSQQAGIELFLAGLRDWNGGLRRQVDDGQSKDQLAALRAWEYQTPFT